MTAFAPPEPGPHHTPTEACFVGLSDWSGREVWIEQADEQRPLPYRGDTMLDGFAWGHYGSSARELARSILHEVTDSPVLAEVRCRDFAREVVAQLPADAFRLPRADVVAWIEYDRVPAGIHAAGVHG
jgi:hypothetical protein